jgi:hypothetical protein
LTGKTTNVVVGQPINLACELTGGTINTVNWNLPATNYYFGDYVANNQVGRADPVTNFTNTSMNFYFKDTPGPGSLLTVTCVVNATVSGAATNISRNVRFNVTRPTADFIVVRGSLVYVDANHSQLPNQTVLRLGGHETPQVSFPGIGIWATNLNTFGYPGKWTLVQIVVAMTNKVLLTNGGAFQAVTNGLDKGYPTSEFAFYSNNAPNPPYGYASDSPATTLTNQDSKFRRQDYFQTYLMFNPTNFPGSKAVPIRRFSWEWQGAAIKAANGWIRDESVTNYSRITQPAVNWIVHPSWTNLVPGGQMNYDWKPIPPF